MTWQNFIFVLKNKNSLICVIKAIKFESVLIPEYEQK